MDQYPQLEPDGCDVRLLVETGEVVGYWDDDCDCWRAADDDREVKPIGWKPLLDDRY